MTVNSVNICDGDISLQFVLCESKHQTVYGGDRSNNQLVVISKDHNVSYFLIETIPRKAVFVNDETRLIVGC